MISVIIPWIRREKFKRCKRLVKKNAGTDFEIVSEHDVDRIGCPKMVKRLVERARGDYICFIGDDTMPQKDFLKFALDDMKRLPNGWGESEGWGLVGLNDKTGRTLATHWVAHKKMLFILGGEFFHTGYTHCCCDIELQERAMAEGRFLYSQRAIVLHDHPILKREPITDPDLLRVYSREVWGRDQQLLKQRREKNWP